MDIKNIAKAIELGVCYVKPAPKDGGIRCFDRKMGYGEWIDLTAEEYEIHQKVVNLTKEEKLKRLDDLFKESCD